MADHKTRTENSILNIIVGMGGYILNTIVAFACRIVFTQCLSSDYLGLNGLISNFLSILSLAELGIGSAIVYALYKPIAEDNQKKIAAYMRSYRTAYRFIGLAVAVLGIASLPFLQFIVGDTSEIQENIYIVYGIFLFSNVIGYFVNYRISLLIANQKNYIVSGLSYTVSIATSILQIVILKATHDYLIYLIVFLTTSIAFDAIIFLITNKIYPYLREKTEETLNNEERQSLFQNIKRVTVYKFSGVLVNHTDNLVLTYFNGLSITGLASNYVLLVGLLNSFISQVFDSLTASVGNLNAKEGTGKQYTFFNALNFANFWLFGWAAIGIAFVSSDLVVLLFGADYMMEFRIPLILAINMYMVGMQSAIWTFKNTKGMFKYGQYILLFTAALNVVGDIILGKRLGVFGIYLATAIARLCTNTWYEPYAVFKYGFGKSPLLYLKRYLIYIFILLVSGGISAFVCSFVRSTALVNVSAKVVICSLIPNALFYVVFHKKEEFAYLKTLMENGLSKLFRKGEYNGTYRKQET